MFKAFKEYRKSVLTGEMTVRIFAKLFYSGHLCVNALLANTQNNHRQALEIVNILLTERLDLVKEYFSGDRLTKEQIDCIVKLVLTENTAITYHSSQNPLKCTLGGDDWNVVAVCINQLHMFATKISDEDTRNLFMCELDAPLVANDTALICLLFDRLCHANYISHNWQKVLSDKSAIRNGRTNKIITASNYSTSLCRARKRYTSGNSIINELIKHLEMKHQ